MALAASHLHGGVDIPRTDGQRTLEDAGERQHIVDLIREIRTAGADNADARLLGRGQA